MLEAFSETVKMLNLLQFSSHEQEMFSPQQHKLAL